MYQKGKTFHSQRKNHKGCKTTVESKIVDEETLTNEIVLLLIKKSVNVNSNFMRPLALSSNYFKIGSFAFQGIKEFDILNMPRGYIEIASNVFFVGGHSSSKDSR